MTHTLNNPLDIIFIDNITTYATIGIHDFEKAAPQKLIISVALGTDITPAAMSDDVQYALDYDKISRFIDAFIRDSRVELLETLAEKLVKALFEQFNMQSIQLKIQKPGAIAYTQQVGLSIYRVREA